MIAVLLATVAAPAAIAPPFAPPAAVLRYRDVEIHPGSAARIVRSQRLRFTHAGDGYRLEQVTDALAIAAPPPAKAALELLLRPRVGVPLTLAVDRDGAAGEPLAPEAAWAAYRAGITALDRCNAANPSVAGEVGATAHVLLEAEADEHRRDDALRALVLPMLPPPLPALAPGETRTVAGPVRAPAGTLPGTGEVTLRAADAQRLAYHIVLRTGGAGDLAAAAMRDAVAGTSDPDARARVAAGAERLAGADLIETSDVVLDRSSGLIVSATVTQAIQPPGGAARVVVSRSITAAR